MQTGQVDRGGDDLGVAAGLVQAAGGTGQVAAAGVRHNNGVRMTAILFNELVAELPAERFHAADAEGAVEGGVEVAGILKHHQRLIEEFGADREL